MNTIKTYDGPGRARKGCPNGHYVHAKTAVCVCGYRFRPDYAPVLPKEATVYNEAGKGRKQCPDCHKYVGVRSTECVCGFSFSGYVKPKDVETTVTYTEGGKGKKQCAHCNKFVGARVKTCECGHSFIPTNEPEADLVLTDTDEDGDGEDYHPISFRHKLGFPNHRCTLIPAGECPVKLSGTDKEIVLDWIERVQEIFINKNEVLAPSGFIYYASHFYNNFTAEHHKVKQIITNHFAQLLA